MAATKAGSSLPTAKSGDGQVVRASPYGKDPEAIVDQAVEINRMRGRNLYIGQALRKPAPGAKCRRPSGQSLRLLLR